MNWVGDAFQNFCILQLSFWDGPAGIGIQLGRNTEQTVDTFATADVDLSVVQNGAEVRDLTRMVVSSIAPASIVPASIASAKA